MSSANNSSPKAGESTSPRRKVSLAPKNKLDAVYRMEDTSKSTQKPQLKITRNNLGTVVFVFFGIFFDLVFRDKQVEDIFINFI